MHEFPPLCVLCGFARALPCLHPGRVKPPSKAGTAEEKTTKGTKDTKSDSRLRVLDSLRLGGFARALPCPNPVPVAPIFKPKIAESPEGK